MPAAASKALALTADRVDLVAGVLVLRASRSVTPVYTAPCPSPALLDDLDLAPWPSTWIPGCARCTPSCQQPGYPDSTGLGHSFGIDGVPLNLVQKWLGHAQLTTTAIYANAVGAEEQDIARRMWG